MNVRARGYAVFAARVILGAIFVVAGVLKAHDGPAASAAAVAAYRVLPAFLAGPLGIVLPYVEILLGGYLLAGFFARAAAYVATAQLAIFAVAVASLVIRKIPADCGCFGSSVPTPPSWGHVGADIALASLAYFAAKYAPGAFAFDGSQPSGSPGGDGEPNPV